METEVLRIMGLLPPIMGIGQYFGSAILRGNTTFIDELDISLPYGIEIQFYSPSGEYVGMVGTTFDNANLVNWKLTEEKIGGVINFEFSISRKVDIGFYNLMECRIFKDGKFWFSGEMQVKRNEDSNNPNYKYEGRGWISYLKEIKIDELYQNMTLQEIVEDLVSTYLAPNTPIEYNPSLINCPDYTVTKLEYKKKTIDKALQDILEIANINYTTIQFRYGIDENKQFYFSYIDLDPIMGLFEGYQFQNPDVKENLKSVINQIDIYRAKENSQDVEFVSRIEDTESQGNYGLRNKDITISDFVDTATAERIATAIIERFKEPLLEISIKDLGTDLYPFSLNDYYTINNKRDDYKTTINEFEDVTKWDLTNATNTTIIDTDEKVLSGKRAFKITTNINSLGEYIEYTLEEAFNFPSTLRIYVSQSEPGELFGVEMEDEGENTISLDTIYILGENGEYIAGENGYLIEAEVSGVDLRLVEDYQEQRYDISALDNIKKFRIYFLTSDTTTLYFDRFDIFSMTYKQHKIAIEKIEYKQQGNAILADVIFGEEFDNIINDIKKIDDNQINLFNIFQKS